MVEKCWPKRPLIFPCALLAAIRGTVRTMHRQVRYRGYPAKDYDALSADLFRIFFHYRGRGNPMPHGELGCGIGLTENASISDASLLLSAVARAVSSMIMSTWRV